MSKLNSTLSEKMTELDGIVAWFDSEEFSLELALQRYQEAEKLANEIDAELASFKNEITVLKERFDQE